MSSTPKPQPGLDLEQNARFQRVEWFIQRIGWALLAAFLLAGIIGLLGPGPFSNREAVTPDGNLRVKYSRIDHYHHEGELEVHLQPQAAQDEKVRLWLPRQYLDAFEIRTLRPEPLKQEAVGDRIIFEFVTGSLSAPLVIKFGIEPKSMGSLHGRTGIEGGQEVEFRQYILP